MPSSIAVGPLLNTQNRQSRWAARPIIFHGQKSAFKGVGRRIAKPHPRLSIADAMPMPHPLSDRKNIAVARPLRELAGPF